MRWQALLFSFPMATAALADVPNVATDIAPVHSLVATVMGELGTPDLILPADGDPHHFQLRPSQMRSIIDADLIVWIGPDLTPWLDDVLHSAVVDGREDLQLMEPDHLPMVIEGTMATLNLPEQINDQDTDYHASDEDHDDHAEEQADEHKEELAEEHDAHAGHSHGPIDPHVWLDPMNAVHFLDEIAETLSDLDPENAGIYTENADLAKTRLTQMTDQLLLDLQPMSNATLIPYHDAYKYFFIRFGLQVTGTLSATDAAAPSAARLSDVRDVLASKSRPCVFTEPGANQRLIDSVISSDQETVIRHLDGLGTTLPPGPDLYEALITNMAREILSCRS